MNVCFASMRAVGRFSNEPRRTFKSPAFANAILANFRSALNGRCTKHNLQCHRTYTHINTGSFGRIPYAADNRMVIHDKFGRHTYGNIFKCANIVSDCILDILNVDTLNGKRIALLCPHNNSYVVALWAIWIANGIAVPLNASYPRHELNYFIEDSESELLIYTKEYVDRVPQEQTLPLVRLSEKDYDTTENLVIRNQTVDEIVTRRKEQEAGAHGNTDDAALVIYTSGTTGRPKGVVHTHKSLHAQINGMIDSWGWTSDDVILHVLPLHHVHGIVNVLLTPMMVGATCVMPQQRNELAIWEYLLSKNKQELDAPVNVFMAVPTIYAKLISHYERVTVESGALCDFTPQAVKEQCCDNIRLMVSGSAALPEPVMKAWEEITGHTLLERYGMTEIGMGLTNPLHGTRVPGAVGTPFPQVQARIVTSCNESTGDDVIVVQGDSDVITVTPGYEDKEGELQIKGPTVFKHYLNKPEATRDAFTQDGWFKTGDTAVYKNEVFKILGRTSVDIIKSGGYKISALDIERHLLSHDVISDVAVLGVPDVTYGELVAAIIVVKPDCSLEISDLNVWCKTIMASYHAPKVWKIVEQMPRNAMGKVNKKELLNTFFVNNINQDSDF